MVWSSAKQKKRFLLLFLEKEHSSTKSLGGKPPNPQGRLRRGLSMEWSSAKQNYAFCFFFWKKKKAVRSIESLMEKLRSTDN
jgi:hypothetical protein